MASKVSKEGLGLACSEDTIANSSDFNFVALQHMQTPTHPDTCIPLATDSEPLNILISEDDVACAVLSFSFVSVVGPDCL